MEPAKISDLTSIFNNAVSSLLSLGGIVLFVLLLSGGFKYITSGGDPKAVEGAQKTITYAILGIVLLLFSYLILVFLTEITGTDVTKFNPVINPQ